VGEKDPAPNMSINVGKLPFEIFEQMRIAMNHYPLLPGVGEMADEKRSTVVSEPFEVFLFQKFLRIAGTTFNSQSRRRRLRSPFSGHVMKGNKKTIHDDPILPALCIGATAKIISPDQAKASMVRLLHRN
jgi:hypothetical protein